MWERTISRNVVLGEVRVVGVNECLGKSPGQADARIERADGEQPGSAGELACRGFDDERRAEEG